MRTTGIGLTLVASLLASDVHAQSTDDFPPLPNVLLLVDTSGSMEYNLRGFLPDDPADLNPMGGRYQCTTAATLTGNDTRFTSRWMELSQVLTGNITDLRCYSHDREDAEFIQEFTLEPLSAFPVPPYDQGYFLPYHRAVSNDCMYTPGAYDPFNMLGWDTAAFGQRRQSTPLTPADPCTTFAQTRDGIIDTYRDRVRFGLFTFDSRPNDGIGATAAGLNIDAQGGVDGHWSYFADWEGGGASPITGNPPDCDPGLQNQIHEVGARNPSAPPWEGRMINHGPVYASLQETRDHNDRVQETLLSLRPYGATPLAGMLDDARYFIRRDDMDDGFYRTPTFLTDEKFAPAMDPLLNTTVTTPGTLGTCRQQYIIVLSDGEPNLDMMPYCGQNSAITCPPNPPADCPPIDGNCPYQEPWQIAEDLYNGTTTNVLNAAGTPRVTTFVIGFGLGDADDAGSPVDCEMLNAPGAGGFDVDSHCGGSPTGALAACCELAHIAHAGGTVNARFADDVPGLKTALATILDSILVTPTSRTVPSFINTSPVDGGMGNVNAPAVSYEFASAFTPQPGDLWRGNIERKRWVCDVDPMDPTSTIASVAPVDPALGDDFNVNMHSGSGPERQFFSAVPTSAPPASTVAEPTWTIRPNIALPTDGAGNYGYPAGTALTATAPQAGAAFAADVGGEPEVMGASPAVPVACTGPDLVEPNPALCATAIMTWNVGLTAVGLPDRADNQLGAVYHSSPRVVGPPRAITSDASYSIFQNRDNCSGACALNGTCGTCSASAPLLLGPRPLSMYVATVDGQLHGFKVAASDPSDSNPVRNNHNNEMWSFIPPYVLPSIHTMYPNTPANLLDGKITVRDIPFERTQTQAEDSNAPYRTVLVGSGGIAGGFYYAIDVTRPESPEFLWQLSTDAGGEPLFGNSAGEPAIGMVPYRESGTVKEVAVAILPGGDGTPDTSGSPPPNCGDRLVPTPDNMDTLPPTPNRTPRATVKCFVDGPSKSVTVVRLSDGQILRQFRRYEATSGPASINTAGVVYGDVSVDEPILAAVAYPNGTGQVSSRAYLTGQDGSIYRIGFVSPDPAQWTFDLFWDAYPFATDNANNGQPVSVLPSISTDELGNTVLVFSTGDQDDFRSTTTNNRVWSVTEYPLGTTNFDFQVESNWFLGEDAVSGAPGTTDTQYGMFPGEKVTGPIATFGGVAYFSTLTPPPADRACLVGSGRIWAVKFTSTDGDKVPDPGFLPNIYNQALPQGESPFGVAVTAEPSCRDEDNRDDNYVGNHNVATQQSAANYVLRFFTGTGAGADDGSGSNVNVSRIEIPEPETTVTIDSWASIVD